MSEELLQLLKDLHGITNKLTLTGEGVSGNLQEGWTVDVENQGGPFIPPSP